MSESSSYSTFPALTLLLPLGEKLLNVVWVKPDKRAKTTSSYNMTVATTAVSTTEI